MPAAAVIPAPIAYIKVVAVKKLVVGFRGSLCNSCAVETCLLRAKAFDGGKATAGGAHSHFSKTSRALHWALWSRIRDIYFEKIRVFKAGFYA